MSSIPTTEDASRSAGGFRARLPQLAVALPGACLLIVTAALLLGEAVGYTRLWPTRTINLAEAATLRDEAEVMRLLGQGADPNVRYRIRRGFSRDEELTLTPLEAAVGERREQMVELLLEQGIRLDATAWTRLVCFAEHIDAPRVRDVLGRHRPDVLNPEPAAGRVDCTGVETPW